MSSTVDVAIVQFKPRKGEVAANFETLGAIFAQLASAEQMPELIVLPEAALTGYFLEGAVYELAVPSTVFARQLHDVWKKHAAGRSVDIVCGFFENDGGRYYNSALYARVGGVEGPVIVHVHRKMFLPTYGVFDEERFHSRGRRLGVFPSAFGTAAILICEDAWHSIMPTVAALKGARLLIVPSASPGRGLTGAQLESVTRWRTLLGAHASEHGVYVLYAGLTGFEGGKGLSGASCAFSPRGEVLVAAPELEPCILRVRLDAAEIDVARATFPLLGDLEAVLPDLWFDDELPLPRRPYDEA
jgi:predicted amidohydrolase